MYWRVKIPFYPYQALMMISLLLRSQVCDIFSGISNHRHHSSQNGPVSSEKIIKGKGYHQYQPGKKSTSQHKYLCIPDQFLIVSELICFPKIKPQENNGDNCIVEAKFQKW